MWRAKNNKLKPATRFGAKVSMWCGGRSLKFARFELYALIFARFEPCTYCYLNFARFRTPFHWFSHAFTPCLIRAKKRERFGENRIRAKFSKRISTVRKTTHEFKVCENQHYIMRFLETRNACENQHSKSDELKACDFQRSETKRANFRINGRSVRISELSHYNNMIYSNT